MSKRYVEVAVISNAHPGIFSCRAEELTNYVKSISPRILILNVDIINSRQNSKRFFPFSHISVLKEILQMMHQYSNNQDRETQFFSNPCNY